ncbi:protein O-linked-mannose beta-1,4-N-acetylglucosaminyltransferase 2-like [Panicum miliaceum]|uniref:Protein O-linked-mannose beta-1,4-N-acetylglucosaminyltransferase 2-like n=1 Tax=Panicum miliaceum TaxID=4540 RepID=A0A3L6SSR5_PANMI|nr:protein O-linked-mannose beta-1,4-N-acetylglucosaminyltransferase 2-like [Panicum miliaceum]
MKSWVQSHLNVGLIVGVLFVVLTYLLVWQQAATTGGTRVVTTVAQWLVDKQLSEGEGSSEKVVTNGAQQIVDKQLIQAPSETEAVTTKVMCSTEERLSDYCELDGDVRIRGRAWSVDVVPPSWSSERRAWKIRPYSRRSATHVDTLNVTQLQGPGGAPACTVTYSKPAIIFALGGYSGNVFHDHADVLLPLFYLSRQYGREVQLLVINRVQPWWLGKYRLALRAMSRYDVVNLDGDTHVRCFRRVTVGLRLHKDFGIVPERVPGVRLAMPDFTRFLREAYGLPRGAAANPAREPRRRPRLMLIQRQPHRRFLNEREIVRAAEEAGFEVAVTELRIDAAVDEQAPLVNSFDAILGLHGAGMTNEVFLPPGGVLIQVVPLGKLDLMARVEYGEPATEMGLKYLCYNITVQESSLLETLGPDDPAITDPDSVHRRGWAALYDIYLTKQDVRLDIARFSLTLAEAMDHLRRQ